MFLYWQKTMLEKYKRIIHKVIRQGTFQSTPNAARAGCLCAQAKPIRVLCGTRPSCDCLSHTLPAGSSL